MALGHMLQDMMPRLSVKANLSKMYINRCVRASVVTTLKDAGYENPEICAITWHRSVASVQSYDRLDRAGSKRPAGMASALDGSDLASKRVCVERSL